MNMNREEREYVAHSAARCLWWPFLRSKEGPGNLGGERTFAALRRKLGQPNKAYFRNR